MSLVIVVEGSEGVGTSRVVEGHGRRVDQSLESDAIAGDGIRGELLGQVVGVDPELERIAIVAGIESGRCIVGEVGIVTRAFEDGRSRDVLRRKRCSDPLEGNVGSAVPASEDKFSGGEVAGAVQGDGDFSIGGVVRQFGRVD